MLDGIVRTKDENAAQKRAAMKESRTEQEEEKQKLMLAKGMLKEQGRGFLDLMRRNSSVSQPGVVPDQKLSGKVFSAQDLYRPP